MSERGGGVVIWREGHCRIVFESFAQVPGGRAADGSLVMQVSCL